LGVSFPKIKSDPVSKQKLSEGSDFHVMLRERMVLNILPNL
jgi:hypothetical protein